MNLIIRLLLNALVVFAAAYVLPGVDVDGFVVAIIVAVFLAVSNTVVRPILILLTLPATILSLGLFLFVINAMMVLLVAWLVPGFHVGGFWWALLFSLIVSIVGSVLHGLAQDRHQSA